MSVRRDQSQYGSAKLRGGMLPARLRFSVRRGVTLVELMISMLILTIVCTAWLEIISIQSAKKEARRREAVERLAGMMDAFMYVNKNTSSVATGFYEEQALGANIKFKEKGKDSTVYKMFAEELSPIGYQLYVFDRDSGGWDECRWLEGRLYSKNGSTNDTGNAFFSISVCMGLR